jgi:hypothetical protein
MKTEIRIRHCTISEASPRFIIAEAGVTCNYNLTKIPKAKSSAWKGYP